MQDFYLIRPNILVVCSQSLGAAYLRFTWVQRDSYVSWQVLMLGQSTTINLPALWLDDEDRSLWEACVTSQGRQQYMAQCGATAPVPRSHSLCQRLKQAERVRGPWSWQWILILILKAQKKIWEWPDIWAWLVFAHIRRWKSGGCRVVWGLCCEACRRPQSCEKALHQWNICQTGI